MPDFDFKGQFPIGGYLDSIQKKALAEEEQKRNQQAQFIGSLTAASQGFANVLEKRRQTAEALAQAQTLSENPYFQQVLTGQKPIADRPVAEVAGRPVALSQTAAGDVAAPASPTIKKFSTEQIASLLANPKSLETIFKAKENVDKNAPTINKVARRDALGNVIGYDDVEVQKGGKIVVPSFVKPTAPGKMTDYDKKIYDFVNKFNADPIVRKQNSMLQAANVIRDIVAAGNPIGDNSIATFMSRASGEVGALSEADKRPFGGSQALLARLEAAIKQQKDGRLTEENKKFIVDLANVMGESAEKNIASIAEQRSSQFSPILNVPSDELNQRLNPKKTTGTKKELSAKSSNSDLATMSDEELQRIVEGK